MESKAELPVVTTDTSEFATDVSGEIEVTEIEITGLEVREEFKATCCGVGCNC
jgi:hypothetical protein